MMEHYWLDDYLIQSNIDITGFKDKIDTIVDTIDPEDMNKVSTKGFNSKQFRLWEDREKLSDVIEKIKDSVIENFKFTHNKNINKIKLVNLWTVYGQENSYHKLHYHINFKNTNKALNHISTVTYLSVAEKNIHQSGNFHFVYLKNNQVCYEEIDAKKGNILIMPVRIWHGSYPQGKGLRQTLNLDFEISYE